MQKKLTKHAMLLTLLLPLTLLSTGCTHSTKSIPVAKVEKTLKADLSANVIKSAVLNAAENNGWKLIPTSSNADKLRLKKIFTYKKRSTSPSKRWKKLTVEDVVYLSVDMQKKSIKVHSTKENREYLSSSNNRERFNNNLLQLENSIYLELLPHVL